MQTYFIFVSLLMSIQQLQVNSQGKCPDNQLISKCFGPPCNPTWFNWFGGCTFELQDRVSKKVDIQNALDTVFHILPNNQEYSLNYIDQVMQKTHKIQQTIFSYLFVNKTGQAPKFSDGMKAFEEIVTLMGMNNPQHDAIKWIKENIDKQGNSYKIDITLNKIQAFYQSIFNSLDSTFQISNKLQNNFGQNLISSQEQIVSNLFIVDNDLESTIKIFQNDESHLMKYGYYTYQILIHTGILHLNVKGLLALSSNDIKVQKDCLIRSQEIFKIYQKLFDQYTKQAIIFRKSYVSSVQCTQGQENVCSLTRCFRLAYSWTDEMKNINIEESYQIQTQENQLYSLCTIYGENTFGNLLESERQDYVKQLESKMNEIFNIYKKDFANLYSSINIDIEPKVIEIEDFEDPFIY